MLQTQLSHFTFKSRNNIASQGLLEINDGKFHTHADRKSINEKRGLCKSPSLKDIFCNSYVNMYINHSHRKKRFSTSVK